MIEAVIARSSPGIVEEGAELGGAGRLASVGASGFRFDAPNLIWFCVPDAEIARAARRFAEKVEWKGRVALHSSGALTSDELGSVCAAAERRSRQCIR